MAERLAARLPASLIAEREGAVAILRLNRPQKRNALNDEAIVGIEKNCSIPTIASSLSALRFCGLLSRRMATAPSRSAMRDAGSRAARRSAIIPPRRHQDARRVFRVVRVPGPEFG